VSVPAGPTALPDLAHLEVAAAPPEHPRRSFVEHVMGLPVSVHVRGPLARGLEVEDAVRRMAMALHADDATFSTWKPQSEVSRIRRGELRLEDAGSRVQRAAELCREAEHRTAGAFSAWLPGTDGRPAFDPTGLVKGWVVQEALDALVDRLAGLASSGHDVLVSAGGDVAVACQRTDTPDWVVGIEDPQDRSRVLRTVSLRRGAVATSGTAARGAHIVDPGTGGPARGLLSATVVGPSLTWADVYATAAFVRGLDGMPWLGTLPDHTAVLVATDGTVHVVPPEVSPAAGGRATRGGGQASQSAASRA
jgi:thiamine biosynthesis lipoprotein